MLKHEWVLAIDLDDTLYHERDYVKSGICHIENFLSKLYGIDNLSEDVSRFVRANPRINFKKLLIDLNLPVEAEQQLVWLYRSHWPNIRLSKNTSCWLDKCKRDFAGLAIITDGRSITQRLKLSALGLTDIPAYISEEIGFEKPNLKSFKLIEQRWPHLKYAYIGDNLNKDFIAPNTLSWSSVCLRDTGRNVHEQILSKYHTVLQKPQHWIDELSQFDSLDI